MRYENDDEDNLPDVSLSAKFVSGFGFFCVAGSCFSVVGIIFSVLILESGDELLSVITPLFAGAITLSLSGSLLIMASEITQTLLRIESKL